MDDGGIAVGIDVGGSGIKAGAVEVAGGTLVGQRLRVATPSPSIPPAVVDSIERLVNRVARAAGAGHAPVGVGIPAVVIDGVARSAANIDQAWIGFDLETALREALDRPVRILNDADAAGIAEMRFGAGKGEPGSVLVVTLGTGFGSALFIDGRLVPNTELGHMEIRGRDAEKRSAAAARIRRGLSWKAWATDLDEHLQAIDRLFSPNLIIIGGGVSKRADKFLPRLTVDTRVVPARFLNDAGIVGAALAAADRFGAVVPEAVPGA